MAVPPTPMPSPQNCQHNTEGPQCEKCKPGFFGDATQGTATACRPCPCPYTEPSRRWVLPQEVWGGMVAHHGPMSPSPCPQVLRVVLPGHRWPGHLRRLRPRLCWPPLREVGGQGVVKRGLGAWAPRPPPTGPCPHPPPGAPQAMRETPSSQAASAPASVSAVPLSPRAPPALPVPHRLSPQARSSSSVIHVGARTRWAARAAARWVSTCPKPAAPRLVPASPSPVPRGTQFIFPSTQFPTASLWHPVQFPRVFQSSHSTQFVSPPGT